MSYRHISNLFKDQMIFIFKECFAMEKVHGCLNNTSQVRMADGSTKTITKVRDGDYVLGYKNGVVLPTLVTASMNNGRSDRWLRIVSTRGGAGRGPSTASVICTPNHRFFTPTSKNYTQASDLRVGDIVGVVRNDLELSYIQKQVLLGIILGDGYLQLCSNTACVQFCHSVNHRSYFEYIIKCLGELVVSHPTEYAGGYPGSSHVLRCLTVRNHFVFTEFKDFIAGGKKVIPTNFSELLDPISLSFWYMDDGSLEVPKEGSEYKARLATHCFTFNDQRDNILPAFKKFGITPALQKTKNTGWTEYKYCLRFNTRDAIKLFLLVAPYMPECMQYKLPPAFRGHKAFLPEVQNGLKGTFVIQKIKSVRDITKHINSNKYDITTETGNFFAPDILVHNSSAHITFERQTPIDIPKMVEFQGNIIPTCELDPVEYQAMFPDTIHLNFFSGGAKQELFEKIFDKDDLKKRFSITPFKKLVVYGEVYGGSMQGMSATYGKELKFIAFECLSGDKWFDVPKAEHFAKELGLEFVPYEKIPATLDAINTERDRESVVAIRNGMGPGHKREGVVLRPLVEFVHQGDHGGVIRSKHKNEEARETKSKREVVQDPNYLKVLADAEQISEEWVTEMRLVHVLDSIKSENPGLEEADIGLDKVIPAMLEDVEREGAGEIVVGKETRRAITKKTVALFKEMQMKSLEGK